MIDCKPIPLFCYSNYYDAGQRDFSPPKKYAQCKLNLIFIFQPIYEACAKYSTLYLYIAFLMVYIAIIFWQLIGRFDV